MACNHNFDELIDLVCNLIQDINQDELIDNLTRLFRPINDILSRLDGPPLNQALYQLNQRVFAAHRARASITHPDAPDPASVAAPLQGARSVTVPVIAPVTSPDAAPDATLDAVPDIAPDDASDAAPDVGSNGVDAAPGAAVHQTPAQSAPRRSSRTPHTAPAPSRVIESREGRGQTSVTPHVTSDGGEGNLEDPFVSTTGDEPAQPPSQNAESTKKKTKGKPKGSANKRKKDGDADGESDGLPEPSPGKRRAVDLRKPDGTEVLLEGKKLRPDQVQDIVRAELKRLHVLPLTRKYSAEAFLREAAIAIAEGNGSSTMCQRIIRLLASMFSGESLIAVGKLVKNYIALQPTVASRRRQNEQARIDGTADHGTRGMIGLNNPIYDTFIRSLDACILTARDLQLSDLTLMNVVLMMHDAYNALMDSLSREDERSQELLKRAEEHRDRVYSEARKPTTHEAAIINAMLDLHPDMMDQPADSASHSFFEKQRKLYQRMINMGDTIAMLSNWGWGALLCLIDTPWQRVFERVNVELLRAASAAIIRIDPNVEHTFQNLTNHAALPMFENQSLNFPFVFLRYLNQDAMHTSGKRFSFADLLDRDITGGPGATIMPAASDIGSSMLGVPSPRGLTAPPVASPNTMRRRRAFLAPDSDDGSAGEDDDAIQPSPAPLTRSRRALLAPDSDSEHEDGAEDTRDDSPVRHSTSRAAGAHHLSIRARSSAAPSLPSVLAFQENDATNNEDEEMEDS